MSTYRVHQPTLTKQTRNNSTFNLNSNSMGKFQKDGHVIKIHNFNNRFEQDHQTQRQARIRTGITNIAVSTYMRVHSNNHNHHSPTTTTTKITRTTTTTTTVIIAQQIAMQQNLNDQFQTAEEEDAREWYKALGPADFEKNKTQNEPKETTTRD